MGMSLVNGRYINDAGEVAVLYSPGYGAGWVSWAHSGDPATQEQMLFCPEMVEALVYAEDHGIEKEATTQALESIAKRLFPDNYAGGTRDMEVYWVPQGRLFRISEYDGYERVEILNPADSSWFKA